MPGFVGASPISGRLPSLVRHTACGPDCAWFIGFAVFVVTFVMLFLRSLIAFFAGDLATVRRLAGTRTIDEDVEEELQGSASLAAKAR